ncbi:putative integral membrane protein [Seiridium cardinale]|uniref:Integral membrane protein n=1 Tax=Seiridium cardinale TaxID=138064 RepID=A0ABR2Y2Z3_9PEZI
MVGRTLRHYSIQDGSEVHLILRLRGGRPAKQPIMDIAAGGEIKQAIKRDRYWQGTWDGNNTFSIPIHIVNSNQFRRIAGTAPPPSPVSASAYAEAGLPFFFKSVNEIEQQRGLASGAEPHVTTSLVKLDKKGHRIVHESRQKAYEHVKDPDHMLDWVTPRGDFRTVQDLEMEVEKMRVSDD